MSVEDKNLIAYCGLYGGDYFACKGGGDPPFCKMRKCCQKKSIEGCWECGEFETCEKLDFLKANHGDAHIKNLRIIKKKGIDEFLKGKKHWYVKPR
jgi:hypothetical protein